MKNSMLLPYDVVGHKILDYYDDSRSDLKYRKWSRKPQTNKIVNNNVVFCWYLCVYVAWGENETKETNTRLEYYGYTEIPLGCSHLPTYAALVISLARYEEVLKQQGSFVSNIISL